MENDRSTGNRTLPGVTIHILRGKSTRRSREMRGSTLLIGSEGLCDVQMRSADVAGKHCLISRRSDRVLVSHLEPDYPILLNGVEVTEAELTNGDKLTIGPFELSVTIEHASPSTAPGAIVEPASTVQANDSPAPKARRSVATRARSSFDADGPVEVPTRADSGDRSGVERVDPFGDRSESTADAAQPPAPQQAPSPEELQAHAAKAKELDDLLQGIQKLQGEKQKEIDRREGQLADRLEATEETIELDHRQRRFERSKDKLIRVRRRLIEKLRERQDAALSLQTDVEERAARLADGQRDLDREMEHWKRVGAEMSQRQTEIKQQAAALTARIAEYERDHKDFSAKRTRLEQDLANQRIKERSLESFKNDLEQRKLRIAEEESILAKTQDDLEHKIEQSRLRASEVQRRFEEVQGKARIFERQEQHLKDLAKTNEEQRLAQLDRDRELASRAAALEEKEALLRAEDEHLAQREEDLNIRENALAEESTLVDRKEAEQKRLAQRLAEDRLGLDHLGAEIEERRRVVMKELDDERADGDRRLSAIEEESQRFETRKQEFELYKDQWIARTSMVRESIVEAAQRSGILRARELRLEARIHDQQTVEQGQQARQTALATSIDSFESERSSVEQVAVEQQRRGEEIEIEAARLTKVAGELEERHAEITRRERAWCDEVKKRRAELERQAFEFEHKRTFAERQAVAHRRHVKKLRDVSLKVVQRRKNVHAQASQLERQRVDAHKEIEALRDKQENVRQAILDYIEQAAGRESSVLSWLEIVRTENAELDRIQQAVGAQLERLLHASRESARDDTDSPLAVVPQAEDSDRQPGNGIRNMERLVREWTSRIDRLRQSRDDREISIEEQKNEVEAGQRQLSRLLQLTNAADGATDPIDGDESDPTPIEASAPADQKDVPNATDDPSDASTADAETVDAQTIGAKAVEGDEAEVDSGSAVRHDWASTVATTDQVAVVTDRTPGIDADARKPKASHIGAVDHDDDSFIDPAHAGVGADPDSQSTDEGANVESEPGVEAEAASDERSVPDVPLVGSRERDGSDEELLAHIEALGIADAPRLAAARESAGALGQPLADALDAEGILTRFQLDEVRAGRGEQLRLGAAIVLDALHVGSLATTHLVRVPGNDEPLALRSLAPRWSRDATMRVSYETSIKPLETFRHPHVASVHGIFDAGDRYGVLSEYVEGMSLAALAEQGIPAHALIHLCRQAVSALADAQEVGLVHHGIRPSRLMIGRDGTLKVLGYGEPDWMSKMHRCERGRAILPYLAPEELSTDMPIDVRADLYSVGKAFTQLATDAETRAIARIASLPPVFPAEFGPLLNRLTAEIPSMRCRSVAQVLDQLDAMLATLSPQGDPWPALPAALDGAAPARTPVRLAA